jgi:hypothetical protein
MTHNKLHTIRIDSRSLSVKLEGAVFQKSVILYMRTVRIGNRIGKEQEIQLASVSVTDWGCFP